jgi:hypothetical protein
VESISCEEILQEFREKLGSKFDQPPERAEEIANEIRSFPGSSLSPTSSRTSIPTRTTIW